MGYHALSRHRQVVHQPGDLLIRKVVFLTDRLSLQDIRHLCQRLIGQEQLKRAVLPRFQDAPWETTMAYRSTHQHVLHAGRGESAGRSRVWPDLLAALPAGALSASSIRARGSAI